MLSFVCVCVCAHGEKLQESTILEVRMRYAIQEVSCLRVILRRALNSVKVRADTIIRYRGIITKKEGTVWIEILC